MCIVVTVVGISVVIVVLTTLALAKDNESVINKN